MTDQVQRAAATERGAEPDALQKFASDFQQKKGFYLGLGVVAIVIVIAVLAIKNLGESEPEDHFSPVWNAYSLATDRIVQNRPATDELADAADQALHEISAQIAQNPENVGAVEALEAQYDAVAASRQLDGAIEGGDDEDRPLTASDLQSGDELAAQVERFLADMDSREE